MARFARIDLQMRVDRPIPANRVRVPKLNPFFWPSAFRGTRNCESQVQRGDPCESLEHYEDTGFSANRSARINSREPPPPVRTANRQAIYSCQEFLFETWTQTKILSKESLGLGVGSSFSILTVLLEGREMSQGLCPEQGRNLRCLESRD